MAKKKAVKTEDEDELDDFLEDEEIESVYPTLEEKKEEESITPLAEETIEEEEFELEVPIL